MKVVVAIDSFKGSLSSMEAGIAAKEGILAAHPSAQVVVKPLADGGEGTADALIAGLGGQTISLRVSDPLGAPVSVHYGYWPDRQLAVLEMASAAGITLIPESEKDPLAATTYGVGEMIRDAIQRGCRHFIIGIGGSVTNDGGVGMLKALGYRFLDQNGTDVGMGGSALSKIFSISAAHVLPELKLCQFQIACDVSNPLCGPTGATYIYGPQKGVTEALKAPLDAAMAHYASVTEQTMHNCFRDTPGSGAAGGMGFACLSYLQASLIPGIQLIMEATHLTEELKTADVVVTGEGRLDAQTTMGKAPVGIAKLAKQFGATVIAFSGSATKDATACNAAGIDAFFPILRNVVTLEEALSPETAKENLSLTAEQVFRLLQCRPLR
ncbi:glycerate kinase [Clostridiaceae bacterium 68-1-5]|uniref:Glycerate kinase n=1 Tax=Suipraeoptans intestinalis TaxID=2606628 RepID=A0A6N7UZH9_9FIRM|nr:glycerate kinase [Suipraeoptans intestinalis]MSR93699.1 glycerate kinase [Suipraeoptans intestinalis]